jgi:nucleoside-diphosphate-sugar epimerase
MQVNKSPRVLRSSRSFIPDLPSLELCILGGTGFVGKWLVNALLQMNELEDLNLTLHVVTRNIQRSKNIFPDKFLEHINWIEHDFNYQILDNLPIVNYYVHGPTPSVVDNSIESQESLLRVTLNGVLSIKKSLQRSELVPRVVNLSSGAVYKKGRSVDSPNFERDQVLHDTSNLYAKAKVDSERMFHSMCENNEISLLNLRLFALYGPHLPVDKHFAIGNFMLDALKGRKLSIKGNCKTKRSYLYGADLATAIIRSLFSDYQGILNIGGKSAISMEQLANKINLACGGGGVDLLGEDSEPNFYYPCVSLSEEILGQYEFTPLEEGLRDWKMWLLKTI